MRVLRREPGSAAETLSADFVVAATGRSARLASWLRELGYARPAEERLDVDLGYASVPVRLHGALGADRIVLIGARPNLPRSLGLFAQEHGTWLLTVGGYAGHHPPSELDGLMRFAASIAPLDVTAALHAAEPLGEVASFRFPANLPRFYERMPRWPAGMVPLGDGICAFNPIYGQGMSVAAGQAVALRRAPATGPEHLERRYLSAAAKVVDHAWQLTASADLALPVVAGPRPTRTRLVNAYLRRLHASAARDEALAAAFMRVSGMVDRPPELLRSAVVRRVVAPRGRPRPAVPGLLRVDGIATPLRQAGPTGDSEAVVFVHGNPGSSADFEPLLAAVAERDLRAVAWDEPGFGRADTPADFPHTVEGHAAFIARAPAMLGIERAHLVLHDFGGRWGLQWAVGDPERFATATLLNTGALPGYSWHARGAALAHTAGRRAVHVHNHTRRIPAAAAPRPAGTAATHVRRPHVRRLRPHHAPRRARPLSLAGRRRGRRRAARGRALAARPPRACALGPPRPLHRRPARRTGTPSLPPCRRPCARPCGTLAVHRPAQRGAPPPSPASSPATRSLIAAYEREPRQRGAARAHNGSLGTRGRGSRGARELIEPESSLAS